MAPVNSAKSPKEKIKAVRKNTLQIVESLLEKDISEKWFLESCEKICQADYDDVVQERSIDHLCGYPMCSKPIKQVKQQYRISKAENKVYDLTERKNFCSNECYKASNFFKTQLHSLPLYLRKPDNSSPKLKLLSESENKGSAGEELQFSHTISKKEIEKAYVEPESRAYLSNILKEDIKDCTKHLSSLEIKENVYKEKYVFKKEPDDKLSENSDEDSPSDSECAVSSDEDSTLFQNYDKIDVLSNKHMPVPEKTKKAVLIAPLKAAPVTSANVTSLPINIIANIFQDWFTEDTMKYLIGVRKVYAVKSDYLFQTIVNTDLSPEDMAAFKKEYVDICVKIDQLPDEDDRISDIGEVEISKPKPVKKSQAKLENLALEMDSKLEAAKTVPKRKMKRKSPGKGKSVSFAPGTKSSIDKSKAINLPAELDPSLSESTLPLVDSLSQNTLRKQVLMGKIKNVFMNILPVIDLQYRDIKDEMKDLVATFSLTPANIVHKPKQLNCIAVVIFQLLTKTKLKELEQEFDFSKLCEKALSSVNISQEEVESLALDLLSSDQVKRLQRVVMK